MKQSEMKTKQLEIVICGSMSFEKELLGISQKLKKMGFKTVLPLATEDLVGKKRHDELKVEKDLIRYYFEKIKRADAILVPNFDKKGIKNYIGGNTLMEIGFAYVLGKKIFLLNPVPKMSYSDEIKAMNPVILNGNLNKISKKQKPLYG